MRDNIRDISPSKSTRLSIAGSVLWDDVVKTKAPLLYRFGFYSMRILALGVKERQIFAYGLATTTW